MKKLMKICFLFALIAAISFKGVAGPPIKENPKYELNVQKCELVSVDVVVMEVMNPSLLIEADAECFNYEAFIISESKNDKIIILPVDVGKYSPYATTIIFAKQQIVREVKSDLSFIKKPAWS